MKRLITALCLAFVLSDQCAAYDKRLIHVLEQLRDCRIEIDEDLPAVGGPAVGYTGEPHEFYLLFPYVVRIAAEDDLKEMLSDKSPVVRIMGAKCAVMRKASGLGDSMDELEKDQTKVYVAPYGCCVTRWTVGEVVTELKKHPTFLEEEEEESRPNQAPLPTPGKCPPSNHDQLPGAADH